MAKRKATLSERAKAMPAVRPRRNWVNRLPSPVQSELFEFRAAYQRGEFAAPLTALRELVQATYPEAGVPQYCHFRAWMQEGQDDAN